MDSITTAMSTVTDLVGNVFTMMTGNPLLAVYMAAGLLGVGVTVFALIKGAAGAH